MRSLTVAQWQGFQQLTLYAPYPGRPPSSGLWGPPTHTPASVFHPRQCRGRSGSIPERSKRAQKPSAVISVTHVSKLSDKHPHVRCDVGSPVRHRNELLHLLHVSLGLLVTHRMDALSDRLQVLVQDR